jgi:hypothetical protein
MIKMRDPARIDKFCDEFATIWKEYFPDYRWGQLCSNFFGWLANTKQIDLFFPEEDKMLEYLHEYCKGSVSPWKEG